MQNFITLTLFAIVWMTFCQVAIAIYDRICYYVLDYFIKNGNEKEQIRISQIFGV
jgi:hypothetical protein